MFYLTKNRKFVEVLHKAGLLLHTGCHTNIRYIWLTLQKLYCDICHGGQCVCVYGGGHKGDMRRCDTQPLLQLGLRCQFVVYGPLDLVGHFFQMFHTVCVQRSRWNGFLPKGRGFWREKGQKVKEDILASTEGFSRVSMINRWEYVTQSPE